MGLKTFSTDGTDASNPNRALSIILWSSTVILLSFFCLTHLFVTLSFGFGLQVSAVIAPAALLLSLAGGEWLARKEGLGFKMRIIPPAIALIITGIGLFLAASFFDMSWDGLWYHQTAVYRMSKGWNPLFDPLAIFNPNPDMQTWIRHYAKGPWYVALALFTTTGNIEMAKAAPWIVLSASFFAVFAAALDFSVNRGKAILIAVLVCFNPVVLFELASYLVDGLMISFLAIFVAALLRWFKRPTILIIVIMAASAILCINAKMTGLVYLSFFCLAGWLYSLIKRRDLLFRCTTILFIPYALGVLIFGFNPYVTNTLYRGNPFYPMLGSAAYPSLAQRGEDPIEMWETPHNMMGKSRFVRLGYAIFGRPGAQPYYIGQDASLMWPFDVGWKDFSMYYFHDVRISGFGPLFSGVLLLSLVLLGIVFFRPAIPRIVLILTLCAIVLPLFMSIHTWWARYGPQLWWLPITGIIAGLAFSDRRWIKGIAYSLAAILLLNTALIAMVHFKWEVDATRTTYEQMAYLRQKKEIEVDLQYFIEPFSERLHNGGVNFRAVGRLRGNNPMEIISVSPGYPCAVRVCFKH